ncbi:unnamed protein product [Owenia fusiformis]|uniref:Uncharacterized protein n=1 Tax=Owenia fusiformis TaxID=6347 RepID=A0A8J1XPF1_OWEFU|nr:unnamed protein product [Owenia fusiformis]
MKLEVLLVVMLVTLAVNVEAKRKKRKGNSASVTCKKTDIEKIVTKLNELKTETQNCSTGNGEDVSLNVDIANDVTKAKATIDEVKTGVDEITGGISTIKDLLKEMQSSKCESRGEQTDECVGEFLISGPNHRVNDSGLTASTEWDGYHGPSRARLGTQEELPFPGSWSPLTLDANPWIQADLGKLMQVNGVVTQGRAAHAQWVTSYNVSYSEAGSSFEFIEKDGNQIFNGNSDMYTPVLNSFKPVQARYIRISPMTWNNHISLRFDVIGCDD